MDWGIMGFIFGEKKVVSSYFYFEYLRDLDGVFFILLRFWYIVM